MTKRKNNLTPKIISVAIAIFLWSYVMGTENPEWPLEFKNINVEFTNVQALERQSLVVMEPNEIKVNVGVTGRRSNMDSSIADKIVAEIDLRGIGEGQTRVPVNVSLKDSSSSVRITGWEPADVLVTVDKIVTEEKTVNIRTSGSALDDFTVGELDLDPETISIKGPRTWVNRVSDVFVVVPVGNQATSSKSYPVQIIDHNGDEVVGLELMPSVVDVTVPIYRKASLPIEAVFENELPEGYLMSDIKINPSTITVKGGNQVADLTSIKTKPIDINMLLDSPSLEVELDLPENVDLLDPNQRVTISSEIEQIDTREFEFDFSEITMQNLNEELLLEDNEGSFVVQVKGTESVLDSLTKENLKPYMDLNNLSSGEHEVDIQVNDIEGVTIESIEPKKWTIILMNREGG